MRRNASAADRDTLLERGLGQRVIAVRQAQSSQVGEHTGARGPEVGHPRGHIDRIVHVAQSRERVPEQHQRLHVLRIALQRRPRPCFRVLEAAADQEKIAGLDLKLVVLGEEVSCPHVLRQRIAYVVVRRVGVGELPPGQAELGIDLNRAAVFQDRFIMFPASQIRIPGTDMVEFQGVGIAIAAGDGESGDNRTPDPQANHEPTLEPSSEHARMESKGPTLEPAGANRMNRWKNCSFPRQGRQSRLELALEILGWSDFCRLVSDISAPAPRLLEVPSGNNKAGAEQ